MDRDGVLLLAQAVPPELEEILWEILRDFRFAHVQTIMKEKEFNSLVEQIRDDPVPSCPANLEQNVLRRIRLARGREAGLVDWLGSWLTRPAFLATTLAVVVVSSFATASFISLTRHQEDPVAALGFDVFADTIQLPTDH